MRKHHFLLCDCENDIWIAFHFCGYAKFTVYSSERWTDINQCVEIASTRWLKDLEEIDENSTCFGRKVRACAWNWSGSTTNTHYECDSMGYLQYYAISWLHNDISKSIKKSMLFMNSASEIWKLLNTRFQITNGWRKYKLARDLYHIQQNCKSLVKYYIEISSVWEKLQNMSVMPAIEDYHTWDYRVYAWLECDFLGWLCFNIDKRS